MVFKNNTIFNYNIKKLYQLVNNSRTLDLTGFEVNVGNVGWNQVKHLLTNKEFIFINSIICYNIINE